MGVRWDRSQDRLIAKSTFHKLSHGHLVMIVGKVRARFLTWRSLGKANQ